MKTKILAFLIVGGLFGAVLCWPNNEQTTLLAGDIPLQGNQACQACSDNAQAMWEACVNSLPERDEGDADCRIQSDNYLASCQMQHCVNKASHDTSPIDLIMPAARCEGQPKVSPLEAETADDCAACGHFVAGVYFECKGLGGSECACATKAAQTCVSSQFLCVPCQVCVDWSSKAAAACSSAPKKPPTQPGDN